MDSIHNQQLIRQNEALISQNQQIIDLLKSMNEKQDEIIHVLDSITSSGMYYSRRVRVVNS